MSGSLTKFEGIGNASAVMIFAALASNPTTIWMTQGFMGKIFFSFLKYLFSWLASIGLIALNIGAASIQTMVAADDYESTFSNADAMITKIRALGQQLTPEQIQAIDQPVIDAFKKFAHFGKAQDAKSNSSNSDNA